MVELIPKPLSKFIKIKCPKCGNEQITFDKASIKVKCNICDEILAEPSGGRIKLSAEKLQEFD
ncbi:30S ribosomal protein S27e [Candidatus Bathyarchaeota archaeon]|nr:30S ribosomal protein S27e [Candidatus Bathyarchaeota archaeon]